MKCPKDNEHEVVKNTAMGKEFYYCRGCKDEVKDTPEYAPGFGYSLNSGVLNAYYDEMMKQLTYKSMLDNFSKLKETK